MTEETAVNYTVWIVIMVTVAALASYVIWTIYRSEEPFRLLRDILYWLPGMQTIAKMFGGTGITG